MLKAGQSIEDKYKILYEIGRGGMSSVYLAIEEKINKTWAVKAIKKEGVENFKIVKDSLIAESKLLKKLENPHLPAIKDIFDTDSYFFIVMDYIDGRTLEELMREKKKFSMQEVVEIAKQLGDVLSYLHSQTPPIIYRDLKPSNIMRRVDGTITLIDFGTAREYKKQKVEDTVCLGTRGYAAPEQFGGMGQTDARTDIYALGVTMYYLLTGKNPNKPPYEIYPIRYWDDTLSAKIEKVIIKSTKINPDERYQNIKAFMCDLDRYKNKASASILEKYFSRLRMHILTNNKNKEKYKENENNYYNDETYLLQDITYIENNS